MGCAAKGDHFNGNKQTNKKKRAFFILHFIFRKNNVIHDTCVLIHGLDELLEIFMYPLLSNFYGGGTRLFSVFFFFFALWYQGSFFSY